MLDGLFKSRKTVYFPGCLTKLVLEEHYHNWRSILSDLGINYHILPELQCCGAPALHAGYTADFKRIVQENTRILKKNHVKKIISSCSQCVHTFKEHYPVTAEHVTETLYKNKDKIRKENQGEVCYQDSCILARKLNITKEPRDILAQSGFKVKEFKHKKENSYCCGAAGGLAHNNPALAKLLAQKRIAEAGTNSIITACPLCYYHLKQHAERGTIIRELSEVFVEA
ncbi:MAG: (Fe-S)-binding protein [Nanoarchaeota archaeon]